MVDKDRKRAELIKNLDEVHCHGDVEVFWMIADLIY